MTLIATPADPSANSYATEVAATDILTNERVYNAEWLAASTGNRERALIWATHIIDQSFVWSGRIYSLDQVLQWPRVGMIDDDFRYVPNTIIPRKLVGATADLALELLRRDRTATPGLLGLGFSDVSVGPIKVTVDPKMVLDLIPRSVILDLAQWGVPKPQAAGGGMWELDLRRA